MSLRARVLLGGAVIAVVLAVGAVVTIRTTTDHLLDQVDAQLAAAGNPERDFGPPGRPGPAGNLGPDLTTFFVAVLGDGVELVVRTVPNVTGEALAAPTLDSDLVRASAESHEPFTVSTDDGIRYRLLATERGPNVVVVGLPLTDVDDATDRLLAVVGVTTVGVLAVVGLVTWWVLRLGVRPIKQMTATASAIAAGGGGFPAEAPPGTEAGELGAALNDMLGRIEASVERQRRFAADASHELRTPVTTIRGYAELYRAGGLPPGEELDEAMRRTEQEAVRMGGLIEDLLRLARLDQGRPLAAEPVDLAAVVADAGRDASAVAPDRSITVDVPPTPLVVTGDEDRLRQVVANVVSNALVHTPEGTPIELRASIAGDGGTARVEIRDHGPGMAPEVASRAFERFYRADPSRSRHHGGSGLGLAIVEATVGAHGGSVAVESEVGVGTTVRIDLPRTL